MYKSAPILLRMAQDPIQARNKDSLRRSSSGIPLSQDGQVLHRRLQAHQSRAALRHCLIRGLCYIPGRTFYYREGTRTGLGVCPIMVHRVKTRYFFLVLNLDKRERWLGSKKIWIPPNIYVTFTIHHLGPQLCAKREDCAELPLSPF